MLEFILVGFIKKRVCRLFLHGLAGQVYKVSSLFKVDATYYVVIGSNMKLTFSQNTCQDIKLYSSMEIIPGSELELVFDWGLSELKQDLDFIRFETESQLLQNQGRCLRIGHTAVIRTFEYLADVFGILNFTPDSFSDGGKYTHIDAAIARVIELVEQGAHIIDLGAQSTGYGAPTLTALDEQKRLSTILPQIVQLKEEYGFMLSLDTCHASTAQWALNFAVDIINDVSGDMPLDVVKSWTEGSRQYVAMHSLVVPANRNILLALDINPVDTVCEWMRDRLITYHEYGINTPQIILDPGIGYGNNGAQAWMLIKNLSSFKTLPSEIMLAHSRKSFASQVRDRQHAQDLDLESALIATRVLNNVDYLRLHDVNALNTIYPLVHDLRYMEI